MKKHRRIILIALLAAVLLLGIWLRSSRPEHLRVSRRSAISTALSKEGLARKDVYHLKTELDWQGSGNYPCYYIYYTYCDDDGQDICVRAAVDGETGEYLDLDRWAEQAAGPFLGQPLLYHIVF